jgi:hypothetical protein
MTRNLLFVLICFSLFSALPVSAKVVVNEVAWMGTDAGANCEWIELYNDADEIVDLSGWKLTIENQSGSPRVLLLSEVGAYSEGIDRYTGIAARGYYLMARNSSNTGVACDDDINGANADWFNSFGSGISNSGATITLVNAVGQEEDVLASKASWAVAEGGVGGKNTEPKETPQRTPNGWLTGLPTPRAQNLSAPTEELPEDDNVPSAPVVTIGGAAPQTPRKHPVLELYVDGGPARVVFAGAETPFTALAYDSSGSVRKSAAISWSFGDGGYEKGDEVSYAYAEPGEYTAVVRARAKGVSAVTLVPVQVVPPPVRISDVTERGIVLSNTSNNLADLSAWKLGTGKRAVSLPPDTVLAPGASVLFTYDGLRLPEGDHPVLKYPSGALAHAYLQPLVAGTSSEEVLLKAERVAVEAYYQSAYGVQKQAPDTTVGAEEKEPRVLLKKDKQGILGFFSAVVASVAALVVP